MQSPLNRIFQATLGWIIVSLLWCNLAVAQTDTPNSSDEKPQATQRRKEKQAPQARKRKQDQPAVGQEMRQKGRSNSNRPRPNSASPKTGPNGGSDPDSNQIQQRLQNIRKTLIAADANGDRMLSLDEAPPMLKDRFDRIDRNSDGFIDAEEVTAMLQVARQRMGSQEGPNGNGSNSKMSEEMKKRRMQRMQRDSQTDSKPVKPIRPGQQK